MSVRLIERSNVHFHTVKADVDQGSEPDLKRTYSDQILCPDHLTVNYKKQNYGSWTVDSVHVQGYRRLASGKLGKEYLSDCLPYYDRSKWPDWVRTAVDRFHPDRKE